MRCGRPELWLAAILLIYILAGCSGLAEPVSLDGSEWVLVSLGGADILAGTRITLEFKDGITSGYTGCNHYGGGYSTDRGNRIKREITSLTVQGCLEPAGVMDQEKAYMDRFFQVSFYRLEGDQLELLDADRNLLLMYTRQPGYSVDPEALKGRTWKLTNLRGKNPANGSLIWLAFEDGTYNGFAGCRHFNGSYEAAGDDLGFPFLEMKDVDCFAPEAFRDQEGIFIDMLSTTEAFNLVDDRLEIFVLDGSSMVFEPASPGDLEAAQIQWELAAFTDGETQLSILPVSQITLIFSENAVSGSAGCNTYSVHFSFDGSFFTFQPPSSTKMSCQEPAGIMEQESRFLTTLQDVVFYQIEGNQLSLQTQDGRGLVFQTTGLRE